MQKEPVVDQAVNTLRRGLPFVQNGMQYTLDTVVSLMECNAEETEKVKSLKDTMLSFCSIQRDMEQAETAAKYVMTQAKSTREAMDLELMFEQKLAELQRANTAESLKEHEKYTELEEHIHTAIQSANDEVEPSSSAVQLDDDLAMTQTEVTTKCPVTKQEMTRPVRNKHCGHVYDYDGARELIKNRLQARCPVAGCANDKPLKLADLEEDKQLKRIIDRQRRKAQKCGNKS